MFATSEIILESRPGGKSGRHRRRSPRCSFISVARKSVDPVVSSCHCGEKLFSQTFTYDPLNRLTANTLGGVANQSWNLDSQGNWSSVTTNGVTQTETANAQNQITSISGTSGTPTYDNNGNMTTDQSGNTYVYNDARGYRVTESYPLGGNGVAAGTVNYIYYDSSWQAIETRTNGTAASNVTSQIVWSAAYVNAAVLQDTYSGGVIQPNSRLYFLQDANWNTTAIVGLVSGTWQVTQRYVYSPYGMITVLNANWLQGGMQPAVDNLYQGMTLDSVTGLYYARNRNYDPTLGRWINQDPLQYINGANTYQFVMSNPVGNVDPWGLYVWYGVKNPGGSPFGTLGGGGGHAFIVVSDQASASGYTVYSFEGGGWQTYNWNQYRNLPDNLNAPMGLYEIPGASAALAIKEVQREIKHGNNMYGPGEVCSTAADKVVLAATAGKPIHTPVKELLKSDQWPNGEVPNLPDAFPRNMEILTNNGLPYRLYPAPPNPQAGQTGFFGGIWQWITFHL
jgi:RHS repeat-associated protein